jgi:hypothetical protein
MKKMTLLMSALLIAGATFAHEGKGCCKGKKEGCSKEKKEACEKGKGCCKKDKKCTITNLIVDLKRKIIHEQNKQKN